MIIALAGKKLAGKTTAANFIFTQTNAQIFTFSDILVQILKLLKKEITRSNLVDLGYGLRQIYSDDILAEVLVKKIKACQSKNVIIDGIRYLDEYKMLKNLPNFNLVYIESDLNCRYQRTKQRYEKKDEIKMTFEEFKLKESDPTEKELQQLQLLANNTIVNQTTINTFYKKISNLL